MTASMILILCAVASLAQNTPAPAERSVFVLSDNWKMQSSLQVDASGEAISRPSFSTEGWYTTSVPSTIIAALVANGRYEDPFYGENLKQITGPEFDKPWWFRKLFTLPASEQHKTVVLRLHGINYRANVWLNGTLVANDEDVVGPFRVFAFDVTSLVNRDGDNVLALEITRPFDPNKRTGDLAIDFADWIPYPADYFGGIVNDVALVTFNGIDIQHPLVTTRFDLPSLTVAHLAVDAEVVNYTDDNARVVVSGTINGDVSFEQQVYVKAHDRKKVTFDPANYAQLNVKYPEIWWPWQLGKPTLSRLEMEVARDDQVTSSFATNFGIREITSDLLSNGARQFYVNGKPIFVQGAGWSPELFLRRSKKRQEQEIQLVKDMGMNTIRFEGKFEDDNLYDLTDRYGMLVITGWMCCGAWQYPERWNDEERHVAIESGRSLMYWLRNRPSILLWMNGSDMPPRDETVERDWLAIEDELKWPNPIVATADGTDSKVSGKSGLKMLGPYEWVPPIYWETDLKQERRRGGAWGFATEISPGPSVPPYESLVKFIPKDSLWYDTSVFRMHAGTMQFSTINVFVEALDNRYGPSKTIQEFAQKAQAQAYEGHRAMIEAYTAHKYTATTGVIQWMLNNAWPGVIWHTYDYFLYPAGTYFGFKKALEPLHIQYSYDTRSVAIVNADHIGYAGLTVNARIYTTDGALKYTRTDTTDVGIDTVVRPFRIPEVDGLSDTYFLRLQLADNTGKPVSINWYWLSKKQDELDWEKSRWFYTPQRAFADHRALETLPQTPLDVAYTTERGTDSTRHTITVANTGEAVAFFVHLRLLKGKDGDDILPVFFSDNYLLLAPGERRTIMASYANDDADGHTAHLVASAWNLDVGASKANTANLSFTNELRAR